MRDPSQAAAALVRDSIEALFELERTALDDDRTLDELGLDSLDRAELALALEEVVRVRYTDQDFVGVETIADLIALTRWKRASAETRAEV